MISVADPRKHGNYIWVPASCHGVAFGVARVAGMTRIFLSSTFIFLFLTLTFPGALSARVVNVYNWAYAIAPDILTQFEKETGIQVNYDVYDSSEVMETKLLAGSSGYDVVGLTVWPDLARQLGANLYQPLNLSLIPQAKGVNPSFLTRMKAVDPDNRFALPSIWGTRGFAFNKRMIEERFPNAPRTSAAMLFDPAVVSRFADCGVILIDSPLDVIPSVLSYLGKDPDSSSPDDLKLASAQLIKVRPFIKKFQAVPSVGDLTSGDYCLVEGFSGELIRGQKLGKAAGMDIEYVIPQEGGALWIDVFAIPQDAPHVREAHAFINFMLRPEIIARVTNATDTANCIPASLPFVEQKIRDNPLVYPPQEVVDTLYVDTTHAPRYERMRSREWTRVKIGR